MRHTMYDSLADIVGGRFQLTALLQKRLRELNRGSRPFVTVDSDNPMDIVIAEIRAGAIKLEPGEDMMQTLRQAAARAEKTEA